MRITGLHCTRCHTHELMAVWPGKDREDAPLLFTMLPGRPVKAWCEKCWLERFGEHPRLPRRGSQPPKTAIAQD